MHVCAYDGNGLPLNYIGFAQNELVSSAGSQAQQLSQELCDLKNNHFKRAIIFREFVMPGNIEKILHELKKGLQAIYGDQLKAVILFGSYARGDEHPPDSDIDVMIVLRGEFDYWKMDELSSELVANLSLENDVLISTKITSETKYAESKMPLYINVRKEGVLV